MFDLPTEYSAQKKEYRQFRKYLIKNGFIMLQQSIYCKLAVNSISSNLIIDNVKKNCPAEGLVQILTVTEKQFAKMEYLVGEMQKEYIDSDDRFIEL